MLQGLPWSMVFLGVIVRRGVPLSCLYPLLTQSLFFLFMIQDNSPARGSWRNYAVFGGPKPSDNSFTVSPDTVYDGSYGNLRNADPYANFTYKMGPFEKFLQNLGFRTKFDKQREEMALASQAYQADITQKQYDEAYDSPNAQADRMRQAGLNPDLQGTSGVQSAAAMSSEDNPAAMVAEPDTLGTPEGFAEFIMSSITTAVGLSKEFMSLKGLSLANEGAAIGNSSNLLNLAFDSILNYTPSIRDLDLETTDGVVSWRDDPTSILNRISSDYKGAMSKRQYRRFMSTVSNMIDSLPVEKEQYRQWRERVENRREYFRSYTRPDYSESDEVLYGISQILSNTAFKAYEKGLNNDVSEQDVRSERLNNELSYQETLDGSLSASAENSGNALSVSTNRVRKLLQDSLNDITSFLKEQSKRGNRLASIALSIISLGSLMNVNVGPSGASIGLK